MAIVAPLSIGDPPRAPALFIMSPVCHCPQVPRLESNSFLQVWLTLGLKVLAGSRSPVVSFLRASAPTLSVWMLCTADIWAKILFPAGALSCLFSAPSLGCSQQTPGNTSCTCSPHMHFRMHAHVHTRIRTHTALELKRT